LFPELVEWRNTWCPFDKLTVTSNSGEGTVSLMLHLEHREHRINVPGAQPELSWNGSTWDILNHGQRVGVLNELRLSGGQDALLYVANALGLEAIADGFYSRDPIQALADLFAMYG
jgi:hypothetical protein